MFRRRLIPDVGGFLFDDDFFCYYEESDFCHRVWLAGYEVHFVPSPPIQHLMGATGQRVLTSGQVQGYYLRNMIFSLLSNLSVPSLLWIGIPFFAMLLLSMLFSIITFRKSAVRAHWGALTENLVNWRKILRRRKLVRQIRKTSDKEIFAKTLRTPKLTYFIKTLRGNLGDYRDRELS